MSSDFLLLSETHEPIRPISESHTQRLLDRGKVTLINQTAKVVALNYPVELPAFQVPFSRSTLRLRDSGTCQYCGLYVPDTGLVSHIKPRTEFSALSDYNSWTNAVWSCRDDVAKGDKTPTTKPASVSKEQFLRLRYADAPWSSYL